MATDVRLVVGALAEFVIRPADFISHAESAIKVTEDEIKYELYMNCWKKWETMQTMQKCKQPPFCPVRPDDIPSEKRKVRNSFEEIK